MKSDNERHGHEHRDSLEEWLREGVEPMEDPGFDDRVMGVVHSLPSPARTRRTATVWQMFQAPAVRRVAATALVSVLLAVLLGSAGVEVLWGAVSSVMEAGGQSPDMLNRSWLETSSIHEWLSVTILLLVLWLLDQTMATVRHRVQPGS